MKRILFFVFFLASIGAQAQPLTAKQKQQDFEYLYETLRDNYPFFGVRKRQGVNWLRYKRRFLATLKATPDDTAYFMTMGKVLAAIGSGHVDANFSTMPTVGAKLYEKVAAEHPRYHTWAETFRAATPRSERWINIALRKMNMTREEYEARMSAMLEGEGKEFEKPTGEIFPEESLAVMRFPSFMMFGESDKFRHQVDSLMMQISGLQLKHLVIDIQGNNGGDVRYWRENIVPRLIRDTAYYEATVFAKGGSVNRKFYPEYFGANARPVQRTEALRNIPKELLKGDFYMHTEVDTIAPRNPIDFQGKIYLLVDGSVFSASEALAQFCKSTSWATVVGKTTGGEGGGTDPAIIVLPESGIIVRYPGTDSFNADGSLNAEMRTVPDIPLQGRRPRLPLFSQPGSAPGHRHPGTARGVARRHGRTAGSPRGAVYRPIRDHGGRYRHSALRQGHSGFF